VLYRPIGYSLIIIGMHQKRKTPTHPTHQV
jgi:hypothetical protein